MIICFHVHRHNTTTLEVETAEYMMEKTIISLIKLLYAVLVIAKYFTFKNTGFHY
jgi:hypothetical protein